MRQKTQNMSFIHAFLLSVIHPRGWVLVKVRKFYETIRGAAGPHARANLLTLLFSHLLLLSRLSLPSPLGLFCPLIHTVGSNVGGSVDTQWTWQDIS